MNKIAIVVDSLMRGGAEHVAVYLADYFTKNNLECELITLRQGEKEYAVPDGVKRICMPAGNMMKKILGLRKAINNSQVDTVLIMGTPLNIFVIPACLGLKVRIVVSERNDPSNFKGKKIVKLFAQNLMRVADGYVFQTKDAQKYYEGIIREQGIIIPNPLFTDNLPDSYCGPRKKSIVTMGRLVPQKNQLLLIDAFSRIAGDFNDYQLVIFGDGGLRQTLQDKISSLRLDDKISLPGNQSNVLELIRDASLFVMSSDFEGMPNALIEAMALGLPCICTDCPCGGPHMLIENGENGLLVPVGDVDQLEAAMRRLLNDPDEAQRIGSNAVKIRDRLNVERIGQQWLEYLK